MGLFMRCAFAPLLRFDVVRGFANTSSRILDMGILKTARERHPRLKKQKKKALQTR